MSHQPSRTPSDSMSNSKISYVTPQGQVEADRLSSSSESSVDNQLRAFDYDKGYENEGDT